MTLPTDGLDTFLPIVVSWFRSTFGTPTPPQSQGWPSIAAGNHTLIFAPTGSGKTLAAFLACLDHLWRRPDRPRGVRILYVSPLKALNQDVSRNLDFPLRGVVEAANAEGIPLSSLSIGIRSGDTSPAERQRLVRKPPDILITTPESLNLMLTSRARETLRSVTHVIIDEIHALCPNKRGVFLALLLERLRALTAEEFVRIGLSATQRPLDEVARYLGGRRLMTGTDGSVSYEPRPVTIIDTGQRKQLDLEVLSPFGHPSGLAAKSVWPAIEGRLLELVKGHRSTIIFANNRRIAERLTTHLNELATDSVVVENIDGEGGVEVDLVRSHHGSLSQEERRSTEESLKRGELAAVVATASLELGIDMGAVDLVCQVESPGSVSRGLQRVGRAGHLVGRVSKGRLIAKTPGDLMESAALCRKMVAGEVETLRVPSNCLDLLAQQVVACVAVDRWNVPALFDLLRCAYPYRDLTPDAFESVLKMISGRFPVGSFRDLRARVVWDRVHNRLAPLPGTARLAITSGGTIPDTGQYPVYLGDGGTRLGELDEEFVLERRVGESFVLGTSTWRIEAIEPQRILVSPGAGRSSVMPFWRGEASPRTPELGEAVGVLCRDLAARRDEPETLDWLRSEYRLELRAAEVLRNFVARQMKVAGCVPDDRTVLVESFRDPSGQTGLAILTPFGGKLHQGLKLAIQARLHQRLGVEAACLHNDDGLLFRLPEMEEPPLDIFDGLTPDLADSLVRAQLGDSALFGLHFRQNAARSLLMPRPDPTKRTPLWLQRLRAKDLLQVVRKFPDFPVVVETYRECLDDHLDLPRLRAFLDSIASGAIRVVTRRGEVPSPFLSELIFQFEHTFLYEWDDPKRTVRSSPAADPVDHSLLDPLLGSSWLDPSAVGRVESRIRGVGNPPRTVDEMAETLRTLGDLDPSELAGPMLGFLQELRQDGRAESFRFESSRPVDRWISAEEHELYSAAFGADEASREGPLKLIVRRFLRTHALVGLDDVLARYPIDPGTAVDLLERWADEGSAIRLDPLEGDDSPRWADPENLAEVRRLSVALRRRESVAVTPEVYADFLLRRQWVHPETRRERSVAVGLVLEQLQGLPASAEAWETTILPARVRDYRPSWLDEALVSSGWCWQAEADGRAEPRVAFHDRDLPPVARPVNDEVSISEAAQQVLAALGRLGASFTADLARASGLEPSRVRSALQELVGLGRATNDRFDPLRPGANAMSMALSEASAAVPRGRAGFRPARPSLRRSASGKAEGRWSRIEPVEAPGDAIEAWAAILLGRYGVLTRETVALDPWAPPWRDLAPFLGRAELQGLVRRGYFVEGLSGVQYADSATAEALASRAADRQDGQPLVLISSIDPANLYGSGAPLDIDLLEGGTARLTRSKSNDLVLCGGRPVLIIEASGKRLTGLASSSEDELRSAIALLPGMTRPSRRVLKVETYNGAAALASPAAPWLAEAGFVRDYPGMAYYAGW